MFFKTDLTMIRELTYKVVAYTVVPNVDSDECVWFNPLFFGVGFYKLK